MQSLQVLMITTSNNGLDDKSTDAGTGVWLQELADPYYLFKDEGECVTISSPKGGNVPIDAKSETPNAITKSTIRFKKDDIAIYHFNHSIPLKEMNADKFDMVFISGGHGCMLDFVNNTTLHDLLQQFIKLDKPVGAVGSGVVALLSLKNAEGIDYLKDKRVTGYSNDEAAQEGIQSKKPFMLESQLLLQGASYTRAEAGKSHIIKDGNLLTGQNPASSLDTAKALLFLARKKNHYTSEPINS